MRRFGKFIALFTLAAFVGFSTAAAIHSHKSLKEPDTCAICKIVHQTPALTSGAAVVRISIEISDVNPVFTPQSYLHVVFTSHGLSPPLA
jgi:hypothetical protein